MQPIVDKLKQEGIEIQAYEIWHNADNEKIFETHDKGRCGGVPFFINPKTDAWICGSTTYEELKKLAE